MIFEAIEFAAAAHAGQWRKGSQVPYIVHPVAVARMLLENGSPEYLAVAGLLHDTVDDTDVTLEQIHARFGPVVADLVQAASSPDRSAGWEVRKQMTIESLKAAGQDALLLAVCDKLDNARSMREDLARVGEELWLRFKRPREQQSWYYRSLAAVLVERIDREPGLHLAREFAHEVDLVFGRAD